AHRNLFHLHYPPWHHVLRQHPSYLPPYLTSFYLLSFPHHHVSHQFSLPSCSHHYCFLHLLLLSQHCLHLSHFYPVASHLYLSIYSPKVLDLPIPPISSSVSCPVYPLPSFLAVRVSHISLCRLVAPPPISSAQSRSSYPYLSHHSHWRWLHLPVQHIYSPVSYRPPYPPSLPSFSLSHLQLLPRHISCHLCRSV